MTRLLTNIATGVRRVGIDALVALEAGRITAAAWQQNTALLGDGLDAGHAELHAVFRLSALDEFIDEFILGDGVKIIHFGNDQVMVRMDRGAANFTLSGHRWDEVIDFYDGFRRKKIADLLLELRERTAETTKDLEPRVDDEWYDDEPDDVVESANDTFKPFEKRLASDPFLEASVCGSDTVVLQERALIVHFSALTYDDGEFVRRIRRFEEGHRANRDIERARIPAEKIRRPTYVLGIGIGGVNVMQVGLGGHVLQRENYSDAVMRGYDRLVEDLKSAEPRGRLALLEGMPGTGKTHLIRSLINDVEDCKFVIVPGKIIDQLSSPDLVTTFIKHAEEDARTLVLVLEDADEALVERRAENMSAISAVLNLSDGILGAVLRLRIIATTNSSSMEMDEAIMRPGRLSERIVVDRLSASEAARAYEKITGFPAGSRFKEEGATLAQVYERAHADRRA